MSRIYPLRHIKGWMRKRKKLNPTATQRNDGSVRCWNTRLEREPLTGMPETEIIPQHAGYVMRNGVYVWGGDGKPRKKP